MDKKQCKYCGEDLTKVLMPPESDWGVEYFLICMNDDCSYFKKGWDWMLEKFKVKASYRYKYNPQNEDDGPIPVTSADDLKGWVVKKFQE